MMRLLKTKCCKRILILLLTLQDTVEIHAVMAGGNERFEIRHGAAIVIDIRNFEPETGLPTRIGAERDRYNMEEFCGAAGLSLPQQWLAEDIVRTDNLSLAEMKNLLEIISQYDFTGQDGFIAFISSHGIKGQLYTTDGQIITIKEIVSTVEGNRSLEGKPKIFFFTNCLDEEIVLPDRQPNGDQPENLPPRPVEPLYFRTSCDVLIGYASVDGYEFPRSVELGSWGARVLRDVLAEHAFDMSLTELLYIALRNGNEGPPGNPGNDRRQVFGYVNTLKKPVYFTRPPPPEEAHREGPHPGSLGA